MAKQPKKIAVCKDFFYDYIGDLETEQLEFIKEHLDLKTMKIGEDKLQEFYEMLCSDGQETLKDEFSGRFEFKRKGKVIIDDSNTNGWTQLSGEVDNDEVLIVTLHNDDEEKIGTITYDKDLYKLKVTESTPGEFIITAEYV